MQDYEKLTNNNMLTETARDFFHLLESFGKNKNIKKFVNVQLIEGPYQRLETSIRGPFQLYLNENLFFLDNNSKLHSYKKLTILAIETLLNKLFTLDQDKNEQIIKAYINEGQIKMIQPTLTVLYQLPILVYIKLVTLDRFSLCGERQRQMDR